jgi:uncharacterized protein YdiU (UPF0061 family)
MADADDEAGVERAVAQATEVIDQFPALYAQALLQGQRAKLGLLAAGPEDDADDAALASDYLSLLENQAIDYTLGWRHLAAAAGGVDGQLRSLFKEPSSLAAWLQRWRERCARDDAAGGPGAVTRAVAMRRTNPWIIPRNHLVEEALAAASNKDDLAPFENLLAAVRQPYDEVAELAAYAEPGSAEVTASYQTFCGT